MRQRCELPEALVHEAGKLQSLDLLIAGDDGLTGGLKTNGDCTCSRILYARDSVVGEVAGTTSLRAHRFGGLCTLLGRLRRSLHHVRW